MHPSVIEFGMRELTPERVAGISVLEVGSYDVNGSLRGHIESLGPASYLGIDMRSGPGVDLVMLAEDLPLRRRFGLVVCTEMLEHSIRWRASLAGVMRSVEPGGLLLLTTRAPGFPLHDYPEDYWRFTPAILGRALARRFDVLVLEDDPGPGHPGILVVARRTSVEEPDVPGHLVAEVAMPGPNDVLPGESPVEGDRDPAVAVGSRWTDETLRSLWEAFHETRRGVGRAWAEAAQASEVANRRIQDLNRSLARLEADRRERAEIRRILRQRAQEVASLAVRLDSLGAGQEQIRALVSEVREQLLAQHEETHARITDLQSILLATLGPPSPGAGSPLASGRRMDPAKHLSYRKLVRRVRETVRSAVPSGATVLVVSRGDDDLLKFGGQVGWHFPQDESGTYAGHHPAGSTAAIASLEALREKGADFVLFPQTAFWWFDHYTDFKRHLDRSHRLIPGDEEVCLLYSLREPAIQSADWQGQLEEVVEECAGQLDADPAILDWHTGLEIAAALPKRAVFSPPERAPVLPYLDESVPVVVLSSAELDALAEARRVASAAVVRIAHTGHRADVTVEWKVAGGRTDPKVSVVIPFVHGPVDVGRCLQRLRESLPPHADIEVVVVHPNGESWTPEDDEDKALARLVKAEGGDGYAAVCNLGAGSAAGDLVVFLDPDSLPLPGWLPAMVRAFRQWPGAGAVGGRAIDATGRLIEAGGTLLVDSSAAPLGDGEANPDAPRYGYVREVDYCSRGLLAARRDLFVEQGGFDVALHAEPYPELDYCQRLRDRGYRVLYQPGIRVVRLHPALGGRDGGGQPSLVRLN